MNLRIVFKFKDCKLQFYEKRRFSYFSVNPRTPASRWRRLLKLKRKKKNSFKIIIGFFFTPPLFLATKVAISFVYCSPKTIKCTQKPKIEKKFTGIDQSSERASECHSPHHIYNSLLRMRAIHELNRVLQVSGEWRAVVAKGDFSFFLLFDIESSGLRTVRLQQEVIFSREKRSFLETNCLDSFPDSSILTSSFA